MRGLLGGAFDPPHNGHVALARAALEQLALDGLTVLVVDDPGHKNVSADAAARLALAKAAFADVERTEVRRDDHRFTVDLLRERPPADGVFLIGDDQFAAFETWKEPDEVLRRVRLGVGTRFGHPRPRVEGDLRGRVLAFDFDSPPIESREIRARVARGEPVGDLVPPGVAELIDRLGLYRHS